MTLPTGQLSPHFARAEFVASETAARHGIDNTPPEYYWALAELLCVRCLEPARLALGPLRISSGYRCPALNSLIGGAAGSQHQALDGMSCAADVVPLQASLGELLRFVVNSTPFDQTIHEFGQWIHVSYSRGHARASVLLAARKPGGGTAYTPLEPEQIATLI